MNVIPLDEAGEPRCSHVSLPLFRFGHIERCLRNYLDNLSHGQWTALATDDISSDVVDLLTQMCRALIGHISTLVYKVIRPQVSCWPHNHDRGDKESSADRINVEPLLDGCSYCRVTEDDIQASLRNIFHNCFGRVLGCGQRRSCDSDKLLTLFSVSIAKNVNSALSRITGSTSLQSDRSTSPTNFVGMVYSVVNILKDCVNISSPLSVDSESSSCTTVESPNSEEDDDFKDDDFKVSTDFKESVETFKSTPTQACVGEGDVGSEGNSDTFQITDVQNLDRESSESEEKCSDAPRCSSGTLPTPAETDTFLSLCLANLVAHVSEKTQTTAVKLNFQQIVTDIREKIGGDLTPLKTVKNLYIIMYKDLCRKFGSKYVLPFVMDKGGATFVAAVVELLKAELKPSSGSRNALRSLESNKSVSPASENKTQRSASDDNVHKGSTGSQKDRPRNCIVRALASFCRSLRRLFSCCMSSETE
ncbi:uncharacterized protein LOC102775699 isoform X2 [Neolamprologus brichardi]|uniref:uncharacterized protein LOC102775699 isoform X2 n=1 Tax=Neolamprologus brichardi TaxID=32507 RepID=UPI0003EBE130|nr:uncharacterized protein LOC102775699 isoform X2 [Neolamprologus brichardi]